MAGIPAPSGNHGEHGAALPNSTYQGMPVVANGATVRPQESNYQDSSAAPAWGFDDLDMDGLQFSYRTLGAVETETETETLT